jgi:hypothetical protein
MANFYSVQRPTFQRAMRNILSIDNSFPALVTTTFDGINPGDHDYSSGLIVRLLVPQGYGMKLPTTFAPITVINTTQFSIPIDTSYLDPFVIPPYRPGAFGTPGQVIPIGELTEILSMATENVLPYP